MIPLVGKNVENNSYVRSLSSLAQFLSNSMKKFYLNKHGRTLVIWLN